MLFPSFVGPAYRARSETIAADDLINAYLEKTETDAEVKVHTYYGTPGLNPYLSVAPDLGCRGSFSQDGFTVTVVGDGLYHIDTVTGTATYLGLIAASSEPVSYASNGRGGEQLAIVGAGQLRILNLVTLALSAPIVLPLTNPATIVQFIDGYFLLLEKDSVRVWFSALEDGTTWDALDFFARSQSSDNLVGMAVLRNRIACLGSQTTDWYYDTGDADNPFQPYPGTLMQEGLVNPWCVSVLGEQLFWLAQDNQGRNRFVSSGLDYKPTVISTPPISFALASYSTLADCEVLAYEQEGHPFLVWSFPSAGAAGATWSYDVREQEWHQRSTWDENLGIDKVWRARGVCSTDAGLIVGDRTTGDLYMLDLDYFLDNTDTIRRLRQAPYLSQENQWVFIDRVELGVQAGVGLISGQGSNPEIMLEVSKDSGNTWLDAGTASPGAIGEYFARAIWRVLGRSRIDRLVFRVTMTDPVRCVWGPGMWVKLRPGSGAL